MAKSEMERAEKLARLFHETYECFAPNFGYKTREASAVPWDDVPEQNKQLMIAVCREIRTALDGETQGLREAATRKESVTLDWYCYCDTCFIARQLQTELEAR